MEELQPEDEMKLKTICEFLFNDIYQYWASYPRFEKIFRPLFNNIEINLYKTFKEIVGELKKYITYNRLIKAFLKYKNNKQLKIDTKSDLYIFFDNLFNNILKRDNSYMGFHEDYSKNTNNNIFSFSTKNNNKNDSNIKKSYISKIIVLNDKQENIRGIMIEYDDYKKCELYPKEMKNKLNIGLELILDIFNKNSYKKHLTQYKNIDMSLYRDSITHIFGTLNKLTNTISFLGFKCISGKIKYIGKPNGEGFLFGEFGKKFHNLKLEMKEKGITLFEPKFVDNNRKNFYLNNKMEIENEDSIFDEEYLKNMKDENEIELFIKTSFLEDDHFSINKTNEGIAELNNKNEVNKKNIELIEDIHQIEENESINDNKNKTIEKIKEKDKYNENNNKSNQDKEHFLPKENIPNDIKSFNHSVENNKENKKEQLSPNYENKKNESENKINKETNSGIIFNKRNFINLKEKLAKSIYKDFYQNYNYNSIIPFNILNEAVPDEEKEREADDKEEEMIEKIKLIKMNGKTIKISNKYDSDDDKDVENKHIKEEDLKEKLINSDANELWKDIGYEFFELLGFDIEYQKIKNNYLKNKNTHEDNWLIMSKGLKRKYGINLFQTIKKVISVICVIKKENFDEMGIKEKIKYYKILTNKYNQKIINFLFKKDEEDIDISNQKTSLMNDKNNDFGEPLEKNENSINKIKNEEQKENNELMSKNIDGNILLEKKNTFIEEIINKTKKEMMEKYNLKSFLFSYQRKRTSMEEIDESNISLIIKNTDDKTEKDKTSKKINISKINTFHGQDNLDQEEDPKFIPNKVSLCPLQEDQKSWKIPKRVLNSDIYQWELIKWRKIENIKMFLRGSQPNIDDIRQGEYIGDCYFLSALGSLCEQKKYLKNLINVIKRGPNKKIYSVKLNINGIWKYVLIDNYIPYIQDNKGNDNFCFGSSFRKELWVSLFEKAWAKINGCYARIGCGGHCSEAFDVLTGAYTELIRITKKDEETKEKLWKKLKQEKINDYIICAGTRHLGLFENVGLISNHAYTIINIYEINYNESQLRLIKLRNPWGEKEFNGDWSDKSPKWNDELKKLVNFEGVKDDGIFYMSFDDFVEYYSLIEILKIKKGYDIIASYKIKKTEAHKCQIIKFEIKENNKNIFINLYQKNPRIIRKNGTYFPEPVKSFIILAKINEDGNYIYIKSISDTKVHLGLEADLEKGKYLIFCDVNYRFVYYEIYGYNITIYSRYSKDEFKLENITNNFNGKKRAEILNKVIYDYFLKNRENQNKIIKVETYKGIIFYKSAKFNEDFPFIIFILINDSEKEGIYFSCKLKYEKRKNVCIYNDSDVSEFDNFVYKEIKNKYNIILFMGYEVSDKFFLQPKFSEIKKNYEHFIFNYDNSNEDNNFKFYISFTARKRGYIFGLKKTNDKKIENINFSVEGMNIVDPLYNDGNDSVYFNMTKKGETKVFNLRLKPDCEDFDYHINY